MFIYICDIVDISQKCILSINTVSFLIFYMFRFIGLSKVLNTNRAKVKNTCRVFILNRDVFVSDNM